MDCFRTDTQSRLFSLTCLLAVTALWCLMRGYQGLDGDAQLYAFQALAKIDRALQADLFLQNSSQDRFTVFTPIYAVLIRLLGVQTASMTLTVLFTLWFYAAAWRLASALGDRYLAWAAIGVLIMTPGDYGASGVFQISERFLTARLPCEALIVTALACHFGRRKFLAVLIASAALFVHPLMGLPGLIVLLIDSVPAKSIVAGASAGIVSCFLVSAAVSKISLLAHAFPLMDPDWLYVVRERSQFLFLELWKARDWDTNMRPLLLLLFIAVARRNVDSRKICFTSLCVGLTGLCVAFIPSVAGPVALLVQGQAWRWIWIGCLLSALLLPGALVDVWNDKRCGILCVVLVLAAWILQNPCGTACVGIGLVLWLSRSRIGESARPYLISAAILVVLAVSAWAVIEAVNWRLSGVVLAGSALLASIRGLLLVRMTALGVAGLLWRRLHEGNNVEWIRVAAPVMCGVGAAALLPWSLVPKSTVGSEAVRAAFSDWSAVIPPSSTVMVISPRDVGEFAWFVLRRPNYLALDQSAGAIFSKVTALEIERRSKVLLPLMEPTWKILSGMRHSQAHPLTPAILQQICQDPGLGFVVAPPTPAFPPPYPPHPAPWQGWQLHDCATVRDQAMPGRVS
jgi:hypothetical protein